MIKVTIQYKSRSTIGQKSFQRWKRCGEGPVHGPKATPVGPGFALISKRWTTLQRNKMFWRMWINILRKRVKQKHATLDAGGRLVECMHASAAKSSCCGSWSVQRPKLRSIASTQRYVDGRPDQPPIKKDGSKATLWDERPKAVIHIASMSVKPGGRRLQPGEPKIFPDWP